MSAIPPDTDTRPSLQDIHSAVLQTTLKTFGSTEDCCVICLSELSEGCEALPCHHADFDFLCLTTWLEQQPACSTCPLCKAEITEIRYDFSSDRAQWKTYHVPSKPAPPPPSQQQQQQQYHRSHDRTRSGPGPHTSPGHFAERRRFDPLGLRRPRPSLYRTRRARGSAQDDDPLRHRRFVYRNQLYSLRVGSNRVSRYRELTPHMFATDAELVSRARMFLRRELQVFEFLAPTSDTSTAAAADQAAAERDPVRRRRANNAEFLLEAAWARPRNSFRSFSGGRTQGCCCTSCARGLRSPYMALENWDNAVQYPELRAKRGRSRSRSPSVEGTWRPGSEQVTYPSTWRRGDSFGDRPGTSRSRFARE
ncbi:RING finger domain-containing protein [Verticillium alfalfae VaMs.102]|uniref:RING-type E3 ubiquitin transferase n=1 Tax=Verticillium alfalfae (strain VaMs.102 / ATCC MYA-4576 / FGSC 10136) TaxID=526221 RepID=C9SGF6_VERA1|nr:RING finger domain-containing protein [Verticillium alfalfae VaMs.102]EEY17496.1 RING finger domain-containing protein [Verticillium alfalfae VaMs.102]